MAEAALTGNFVATIMGVSSVDIVTPTRIAVNPSTNAVLVELTASGGDQDVNLVEVGGVAVALGQTTMSASFPITIASDQSALQVVGSIASGSTDSGNPVKVGAKYNSTKPTFTDGQRGDVQLGTRGSLSVQLFAADSTSTPAIVADNSDGVAAGATTNKLAVRTNNMIYDSVGSAWDRLRGVVNATNSTGTGIAAAGILAQYDDAAPTAITENQFGNLRMSANRNFYTTLRDAAGNERGLNVASTGNISVDTVTTVTTVSTLTTLTGGGIASGSADSGNPVKVGGKYNSSKITLTDGQRGDLQLSANGSLTNAPDTTTEAAADGVSNTLRVYKDVFAFTPVQKVTNFNFNGSTWDRERTVVNATNSTGVGIAAAGLVAQFDDSSPQTVTENQFGNLRMSNQGQLYVEQHYTYGQFTGDTQVKASAGFLHTVTFSEADAAPTAGTIDIYDNTAGSGTKIFTWTITTTVFVPVTITLDVVFATGLYVDFTTTADVSVTVSYR